MIEKNVSLHIEDAGCKEGDKEHLLSKGYKGEPRNHQLKHGPIEDRHCTDLLCFFIFVLFWAGMIVYT